VLAGPEALADASPVSLSSCREDFAGEIEAEARKLARKREIIRTPI